MRFSLVVENLFFCLKQETSPKLAGSPTFVLAIKPIAYRQSVLVAAQRLVFQDRDLQKKRLAAGCMELLLTAMAADIENPQGRVRGG